MRYFEFVLNTSAEKIERNSKIRIKSYDYQSPIAAMNNYVFKNMKKVYVTLLIEKKKKQIGFCAA